MTTDPNASVKFVASVAKVTTLADHGLRVTLDLPEDAIIEAAYLMQCKRDGIALTITCVPYAVEAGESM